MTTPQTTANRSAATRLTRNVGLVLAGTALLAIAAQIKVPMWPVPMTLQTLAVLLIGLTYGRGLAAATLAAYLFEGAMGLPVFTNGGGIAQFVGPTGGYLVGFFLAASFLGIAADRGVTRSVPLLATSLVVATALIYLPGVLWLSGFIGLGKALTAGMVAFLLGDAIKAVIAGMVAMRVRGRAR